ncbi:DUF6287 domain-containing protein [Lactococcus termiticola]|uniref:DUF5648 domain-containing protein n=1 Tax=Lactococcus termiticola TaxID=2169526 RepID=A0A2R5HKE8_9LACT|nr:DUF6287 domain-containing protein [Lactococcus termiticola]GBG97310.1 hypothetical protein NtB2_01449 [Lactococcus termiticola]
MHCQSRPLPTLSLDWHQDTVVFNAPSSGDSVYRLYNSKSGEHLFTTDSNEKSVLTAKGWTYEGVAFHSGGKAPVYRLFNPKAGIGAHLDTASQNELSQLIKTGWKYEGIAWYAESQGAVKIPIRAMNLSEISKGNYNSIYGLWKNQAGGTIGITRDNIVYSLPAANVNGVKVPKYTQQHVLIGALKITDNKATANSNVGEASPPYWTFVPSGVKFDNSFADGSDLSRDRIFFYDFQVRPSVGLLRAQAYYRVY